MARKPSRRKRGQRTRLSVSNLQIRKLQRAVSMRPVKAAIAADPPVRKLSLEGSGIIRCHIIAGTPHTNTGAANYNWDYGTRTKIPTVTIQPDSQCCLTTSDLLALVQAFTYMSGVAGLEVCVRKVSAWGPMTMPTDTESYPRLTVDVGGNSAGLIVSDRAAPDHRSRCAISLPYCVWLGSGDSASVISYLPGVARKSGIVGILDLSLCWRLSELPCI